MNDDDKDELVNLEPTRGADPRSAELVASAARAIGERTSLRHKVAVVLGSGWSGAFADAGPVWQAGAQELPGFHGSVVPGHGGRLAGFESSNGTGILVISARTHLYQGHGAQAVAHPVRTAAALGCSTVVLTNGCGSLRPRFAPGAVVALSDHLNLTGCSPLTGSAFVDLCEVYSHRLRNVARSLEPELHEGVYAQFPGPQYETPAEVRMAGVLGADLVGMSTALEAIAARAAGMQVLGLSLVTNLAAGLAGELDHSEVIATGESARERLDTLLRSIVERLCEQ